uniref:Pre-mRNA-splicing factor ISY1 n=1 Tax=Anthurium amnicola TaxID=1678845 RepID=A0A1D1Y5F7_9ARAE
MDAFSPFNSIFEDFSPCVDNAYCFKLACVGPKQCSLCYSSKENVNAILVEDLNEHRGCLASKDKLKAEELGTAFGGLHIEDFLDKSSGHKLSSELETLCNLKEATECLKDDRQKIFQQDASDGNMRTGLNEFTTFPCPEKMQTSSTPINGGEILPDVPRHNQCSLLSGNPVYARSISLPATSKLLSAMKGGREKEGAPPKTKLKVKWAPDVYDPPATSMSHTVKNHHHHRPKAKRKDYHKKKHKNKSSRGSTREKKHTNQTNIGNFSIPLSSRLHVDENSSVLDVFGRPSVRVLDYTTSSQESKCGSSLLVVGSLSKLHYSVAEAT